MAAPTVASLQAPNPAVSTVSRQPQTTASAQGPFVRIARKAKIQGFTVPGVAFGSGPITQTLKPVGGYLRRLVLTVQATGATSTAAVVAAADAPWSCLQSILVKDPSGAPIYQSDGFGLMLQNVASGQVAELGKQDPTTVPSYSAIQLASGAGAGNFKIRYYIPFELDSAAYGCLPGLNASAQLTVVITPNASGAVYATAPGTLPTLTITVNQEFWTLPVAAPDVTPPGLGSSSQVVQVQGQQGIPTGGFVRTAIPSTGGWWHTAVFVLRDNTGARIEAFPAADMAIMVDGVQLEIDPTDERQDELFHMLGVAFGNTVAYSATPVSLGGVRAYTWRDSVRKAIGMDDTHDVTLPTTPATLMELAGTWGTIANSPATVTAYVAQLYPDNPAGIPYTHLAQ